MNFVAADAAADDFPSVSFTEISFNGLRCESCSTKLSILVSIPAIIFVSGTYGGVGSDAAGGAAGGGAGDSAGGAVNDVGAVNVCGGVNDDAAAGLIPGVIVGDGASSNFFCITSSSINPCLKRSYV